MATKPSLLDAPWRVLALIVGVLGADMGAADKVEPSLQRSEEIYNYATIATQGPGRGLDIYYHKCWKCHNDYAIAAGSPAPILNDLFDRSVLMSGEQTGVETVSEKIRNGGPLMPAYKYELSSQDVADLVSYLREDDCCYLGEEPPANPKYRAAESKPAQVGRGRALRGGARGSVRESAGDPLEGIAVQLVAEANSVRTTVYSDRAGEFEFPELPNGAYSLRIARPLEFEVYQRPGVDIDGSTHLDDIVLQRVEAIEGFEYSELLPPTRSIAGQLTGSEWLMNLSGTGQEKRVFGNACGFACHSYQQIFRNRFDEQGWRQIVQRMTRYAGSPLIVPFGNRRLITYREEAEEVIVKWLARVRGPDSKNAPFKTLPGPRGRATRVVITEYEMPRLLLALHDVDGDSQGNVWYTSHRSPYIGKLDPATGVVTEYRVPSTPGALSGTHTVWVDDNDIVWLSEGWTHKLTKFDPNTERFTQYPLDVPGRPKNYPGFGNFGLAPDGFVWYVMGSAVTKIDPTSGKFLERHPFEVMSFTYDNLISKDGTYWVGGQWPGNLIGVFNIKTGELREYETRSKLSSPAKGAFGWDGIAWFGGRGGQLIGIDPETGRSDEYFPPTPYATFYEAMPDKNGEIWAGEQHGGHFARFNPKTEQWVQYMLPEPFGHNRRTWVDNSTDPVTAWYADHNGYMVRIQPLD
ncbi:MAG: carboxypeptidase regulatory-like domain-containing protein [Gammaproteobacteria bacterium]